MHCVIPWSDGIEGLVMTLPSLLSHLTME